MDKQYKIVWHFEGTTLSSVYEDEEVFENAFNELKENLSHGIKWHALGDTIVNADKVLCITKGEDECKSVKIH